MRVMQGDRVVLRPINEGDLERIVHWRNAARHSFIYDGRITLEGQRAWYDKYLASGDRCFIFQTRDAVPVGMLCLYGIDPQKREAELGRLVLGDDRYAGQGFATDACRVLLEIARELGIERLRLQVLEGNERAVALYQRVGFVMDQGYDAVERRPDGTAVRVLGMSLDFPKGSAGGTG